jgi:hypothetical protein
MVLVVPLSAVKRRSASEQNGADGAAEHEHAYGGDLEARRCVPFWSRTASWRLCDMVWRVCLSWEGRATMQQQAGPHSVAIALESTVRYVCARLSQHPLPPSPPRPHSVKRAVEGRRGPSTVMQPSALRLCLGAELPCNTRRLPRITASSRLCASHDDMSVTCSSGELRRQRCQRRDTTTTTTNTLSSPE